MDDMTGGTITLTCEQLESRGVNLEITRGETTLPLGTCYAKTLFSTYSLPESDSDGKENFVLPTGMTPDNSPTHFRVSGQNKVIDIHEDWEDADLQKSREPSFTS